MNYLHKVPKPESTKPKDRVRPFKKRKCNICPTRFLPFSSTQDCCSWQCALKKAAIDKKKKEKREHREKKESLKTLSEHKKELQTIFNNFIRERDKGLPCICCDKPMGEDKYGGQVDAGHYRSVGSAPHLRYVENNVHAQRKQCNNYGGGRAVDYRIGLIKRIGLEAVEQLEADQAPRQYTIEDIVRLKSEYRAKLKQLKASRK